MIVSDRTWVATAFVPFIHRRVDAIADALVDAVAANGFRPERLRIPVDVRSSGAVGASAAAAALMDVTWGQRLIALEFPCMQLLHGRAAAWRLRDGLHHDVAAIDDNGLGLDADAVAASFERDWVEEGVPSSSASFTVACPAGLLSDDLERRRVVVAGGEGVVVISLHGSVHAQAHVIAASHGDAPVFTPPGDYAAHAAGLEQALWTVAGKLPPACAASVIVVYPADAPEEFVARGPGSAGAHEQWVAVSAADTSREIVVPIGAGVPPAESRAAWTRLAGELVP